MAAGPRPAGSAPLTALATGRSARILHVAPDPPDLVVKLSSLGLIPGAVVVLEQRRPAAVVRVAHTTVALDPDIAAGIFVEPL